MKARSMVDLSEVPVVDAHCHGFEAKALLSREPDGWQDRITVMGMCFESSLTIDRSLAGLVSKMTEGTVFALLGRRWLGEFLGCTPEDVPRVRHAALEADPKGYISRLLADEHLVGLFVDDGYPQPQVNLDELEALVSTSVYRVARIEPLINEARSATNTMDDLEAAFRALLEETAEDPRCVAYKTVIAYRTGLDVGDPTKEEIAESYRRWRDAGWKDGRDTSKAVRDHLLNVTLEVASRQDRPVHIHSGAGDPDVVLSHARPANLGPLLKRFSAQPVVLIHSGYPWLEEATYLASIYPMVYLDLSLLVPWATLDVDRGLGLVLGSVPTNKVLHGSDEASEPEVAWISARLARAALERVLGGAVERDYLTLGEAERIGQAVLADNALRLHGLAG